MGGHDAAHELFGHPFEPYQIQIELMREIYLCINSGCKVGLFESPTGTGKTLSLICSTMTWLRDYKRKHPQGYAGAESAGESDDEPEWVAASLAQSRQLQAASAARDYELHLGTIAERRQRQLAKVHVVEIVKKRKPAQPSDESYMPDDYYSDAEANQDQNDEVSRQVRQLLAQADAKEEPAAPDACPTSILYSSRTHSQLNQFAHQLQLTSFESSFSNLGERTKFMPLASRRQLCIHPAVSKLRDATSVNDACLDLQKPSSEKGCTFLPKSNDPHPATEFVDTAFSAVHDIEDLVSIGKELHICPYYSARRGLAATEIAAMPYQMLLQDSTRRALNLKLKDAIIIIDEAHNLFDVISSIYLARVDDIELGLVLASLKRYLKRFAARLNGGNRVNLMKLIKVCLVLQLYIAQAGPVATSGAQLTPQDIFDHTTVDSVNIHKLDAFLTKSKIAYKIDEWIQSQSELPQLSTPLLFKVAAFLKSLANPSREGSFFWDKTGAATAISYMLLDPSAVFSEMVAQARCVILCGGTMEPMSDYTSYLFPEIPERLVRKFSCNHIIPDANLEVFPLGAWRGVELEFLFDKRNDPAMITALGHMLVQMCRTVPAGVVVFFPSYKYLDLVLVQWQSAVYAQLASAKTIFTEPRDSADTDRVLAQYAAAAGQRGALLLAVVGGKLSEGINFSDELARAVVMVGLPFPNAFSGELVAKRQYVQDSVLRKGGSAAQARDAAQNFYENICMRAVNQSIGRSIRHANDYAILYLVDKRFGSARIQNKLSGWVRRRLTHLNFDAAMATSAKFFDSKHHVAAKDPLLSPRD